MMLITRMDIVITINKNIMLLFRNCHKKNPQIVLNSIISNNSIPQKNKVMYFLNRTKLIKQKDLIQTNYKITMLQELKLNTLTLLEICKTKTIIKLMIKELVQTMVEVLRLFMIQECMNNIKGMI